MFNDSSGCSEPAAIPGGIYRVSDYEVGSSVDYECDYGYEMIGASRAICMVPSEWYPLPPTCKCKAKARLIALHYWTRFSLHPQIIRALPSAIYAIKRWASVYDSKPN